MKSGFTRYRPGRIRELPLAVPWKLQLWIRRVRHGTGFPVDKRLA